MTTEQHRDGMKKPGAVIPRNPANAFTAYVAEAGLSPSRRASVMAQLFSPIHELTGALTQGEERAATFLPNWHSASWCVNFFL